MDAIRNSEDPKRTLESFWKGQLKSKEWLIDNLLPFVHESVTVDICGGWNGLLASLLFQSEIECKFIRSIDIDPCCEEIANTMNKLEQMEGKFQAITSDMCEIKCNADIVINTSCEHITQEGYEAWANNLDSKSLIVLQSNDYLIPEHVRPAISLKNFKLQSSLNVMWEGQLTLPLYNRFMIIGRL